MKKYVTYVNPEKAIDWKYYPIDHDNDWRALPRKIMIDGKAYEMIVDDEINEPFRHLFPDHELKRFEARNQIIDPAAI
jgi:hypothetical protein